jgi:hypothetical protein
MPATHPHLFGDLGDQIPAALLSLGICGPIDDDTGRLEAAVVDLLEFGSSWRTSRGSGIVAREVPRWNCIQGGQDDEFDLIARAIRS